MKCDACAKELKKLAPIRVQEPGQRERIICQACWHKEMKHRKDEIPEENRYRR